MVWSVLNGPGWATAGRHGAGELSAGAGPPSVVELVTKIIVEIVINGGHHLRRSGGDLQHRVRRRFRYRGRLGVGTVKLAPVAIVVPVESGSGIAVRPFRLAEPLALADLGGDRQALGPIGQRVMSY